MAAAFFCFDETLVTIDILYQCPKLHLGSKALISNLCGKFAIVFFSINNYPQSKLYFPILCCELKSNLSILCK